jgi:hypothetical protein
VSLVQLDEWGSMFTDTPAPIIATFRVTAFMMTASMLTRLEYHCITNLEIPERGLNKSQIVQSDGGLKIHRGKHLCTWP